MITCKESVVNFSRQMVDVCVYVVELVKLQLLKQMGKIRITIVKQMFLIYHKMDIQNQVLSGYVIYVVSAVYSVHARLYVYSCF